MLPSRQHLFSGLGYLSKNHKEESSHSACITKAWLHCKTHVSSTVQPANIWLFLKQQNTLTVKQPNTGMGKQQSSAAGLFNSQTEEAMQHIGKYDPVPAFGKLGQIQDEYTVYIQYKSSFSNAMFCSNEWIFASWYYLHFTKCPGYLWIGAVHHKGVFPPRLLFMIYEVTVKPPLSCKITTNQPNRCLEAKFLLSAFSFQDCNLSACWKESVFNARPTPQLFVCSGGVPSCVHVVAVS